MQAVDVKNKVTMAEWVSYGPRKGYLFKFTTPSASVIRQHFKEEFDGAQLTWRLEAILKFEGTDGDMTIISGAKEISLGMSHDQPFRATVKAVAEDAGHGRATKSFTITFQETSSDGTWSTVTKHSD